MNGPPLKRTQGRRVGALLGSVGLVVSGVSSHRIEGPLHYGWVVLALSYAATAVGLHRVVWGERRQPYLLPRAAISIVGAFILIVVVVGIVGVFVPKPEY